MSARAVNDIDLLHLGLRAVLRLRRGREARCYGRARGERTSWMRWRIASAAAGCRWAARGARGGPAPYLRHEENTMFSCHTVTAGTAHPVFYASH